MGIIKVERKPFNLINGILIILKEMLLKHTTIFPITPFGLQFLQEQACLRSDILIIPDLNGADAGICECDSDPKNQ